MPGLEIHEERVVSYDEHGQRTMSSSHFVKLDESVEPLLKRLRGAPLSFFICIAAHEPSVNADGKPAYTRSDVERITGFSKRAIFNAAEMLVSLNFAVVCGTTAHGEKLYRPSGAYAWFGDRYAEIAYPAPPRYAKNDTRLCKKRQSGMQKPSAVVVGRTCLHSLQEVNEFTGKEQQQQLFARARETFLRLGVAEPALSRLSRTVPADNADAWREWSQEAPPSFRDPLAYLIKRLSDDPAGAPPQVKRKHWWNDEYDQFIQR